MTWVDASGLPCRAPPGSFGRGGYHVITLFGIDDANGTALAGDLADAALPAEVSALEALGAWR